MTKQLFLLLFILLLFVLHLAIGTVSIPLTDVFDILLGQPARHESWRFIVLESRLPQALTALLCGAALAVSGLMLQTAFHNPLAGPAIFGINSGAALGAALVMLLFGGSLSIDSFTISGFAAILLAAFAGAMLITLILLGFSTRVRNSVSLLIVGLMIGYLASSAISLLNFFATEEGVKSYLIWGMGNFGGVSLARMPLFAGIVILGLLASLLLVKPLNALLLGEQYAESLGFHIQHTRHLLLAITGLLTAVTTAFCGPIAFIGLAVPHLARLFIQTENHRRLLPTTLLLGSAIALLCSLLCYLPGSQGIIPLNAVTPLIGAPVMVYLMVKR